MKQRDKIPGKYPQKSKKAAINPDCSQTTFCSHSCRKALNFESLYFYKFANNIYSFLIICFHSKIVNFFLLKKAKTKPGV